MKRLYTLLIFSFLVFPVLDAQLDSSTKAYNKYYRSLINNYQSRVQRLIKKGYDINAKNETGETILLTSLKRNKPDFAKLLINSGADVTISDTYGNTCLHYAIENCTDKSIVKTLVEKGADPDAVNKQQYSPFHFSILFACPELPFYFIKKGVNYKRITALNENGLHLAMEAGCDTVTSFLLTKNINLYLQDNRGLTPLLAALYYGHPEHASKLIDMGADVNMYDQYNNTPLFYAIANQDTLNFHKLINNGAEITNGPGGRSLIAAAADNENTHFLKVLLMSGANDSLPGNTHEEYYNLGLVMSVKAELDSCDTCRVRKLEESIDTFMEAKRLYQKEVNELTEAYATEAFYEFLAIGSEILTGVYLGEGNTDAIKAEIDYYKKRIAQCDKQISQLQKLLAEEKKKQQAAGQESPAASTIEL